MIVLAALFGHLHAEGYCADNENTRLEYVRKQSDGRFTWRHILTVTSVIKTGNSRTVTTSSRFLKSNGKPLYKSDVQERFTLDDNYNVRTDMGQMVASYILARTGINATVSGSMAMLPSDMAPGDTLAPINVNAKVGPLIYSVSVTSRKVLRSETISVPAGTFESIVVQEHKVESGLGHHRDVINLSWYVKGVGYVRHDTFIKGVLDTSEVLYSIHGN